MLNLVTLERAVGFLPYMCDLELLKSETTMKRQMLSMFCSKSTS